jgi:two-component system chemotaxis response regulator CheY
MAADKSSFYVIDDDSVLRKLILGILRDAGLEPLGSEASGEAGLSECSKKQPKLVLLDINLPGSSGLDMLAALKRLRNPPAVVMVTSEATLERVKTAMKLGANGFIVKPFTAAKLISAVEAAMRSGNG